MCEACDKAFEFTMKKIIYEVGEIKRDINDEEFRKYLKTDEFRKYAEKRIPEIVKETPIFEVREYEDGKIKNITYE